MSSTTPPRAANIASYAVDLVEALGAHTCFALAGGMAMYLNNAAATHPSLKVVYCQHEQACVNAAEGFAKAADFAAPGFAMVTSGPGVTNTVTALCSAYGDSTPLIVLAGQCKTADIDTFGSRTHGAQEVRSRELISPCVKRFTRVAAETFREDLAATMAEAFAGRPGPVFIEIPLDLQNIPVAYGPEEIAAAAAEVRRRSAEPVGARDLAEALSWVVQGERPLVYLGNGCRIAGAAAAARAFVERTGLPTALSWLSVDILPSDHPLNMGRPGGLAPISANKILYSADRVLFLGARLDLGTTAFQRHDFGAQAERVMVDVDPAELAKFAGLPRTRAVLADLKGFAAAAREVTGFAPEAWARECRALRDAYMAEERRRLEPAELNIYAIADRLSRWSGGKTIAATSSGTASEAFIRFFDPPADTRILFGASLGAMGLCLPLAVGAASQGGRRTVCIDADGGLMLNLQELATLSHYAPPGFVLFIINNGGYASIRTSQERHFGRLGGADASSGVFIPDFGKVSAAFDLAYTRIDSLEALDALLPTLGADAPPRVVDLIAPPSESRGPTVKTVIGADGRLSSTPLSDLQW